MQTKDDFWDNQYTDIAWLCRLSVQQLPYTHSITGTSSIVLKKKLMCYIHVFKCITCLYNCWYNLILRFFATLTNVLKLKKLTTSILAILKHAIWKYCTLLKDSERTRFIWHSYTTSNLYKSNLIELLLKFCKLNLSTQKICNKTILIIQLYNYPIKIPHSVHINFLVLLK